MKSTGEMVAIGLDGTRLSVVHARVSRTVEILRVARATRGAVEGDAGAVGRWVGEELRRAGIRARRAIVAGGRGEVVLKALALPGVGKAREEDVAGMVRLQLSRQLSISTEGAAIDYVASEGSAGDGAVLAGAMPGDRVAWHRAMAAAAGLKLERIGLRAHGTAMVLGEVASRRGGATIGVALGPGEVEFVVIEGGRLAFARVSEVEGPRTADEWEGYADKVAMEAKRTWIAHRAGKAGEAEGVAVLGAGEGAAKVAERCGAVMGVKGEVVGMPGGVGGVEVPREALGGALPLIGLLMEHAGDRVSLDFAGPRRMPDVHAKRRQVALAGVLAGIVLVGGAATMGRMRLSGLRDEAAELSAKVESLTKKRDAYLLEHARLHHIEKWQEAGVDWLAHLRRLSDEMPDPRTALLEVVSGEMGAGEAAYRAPEGGGAYPGGKWEVRRSAQISLSGKMGKREVATELRGRLVSGELGTIYEVNTRGPDLPDRFSLDLVTSRATPEIAPLPAGKGAPAEGGKK